jgi:hypothetical protein
MKMTKIKPVVLSLVLIGILLVGPTTFAQDPSTEEPTVAPTEEATVAATEEPTVAPTEEPTVAATEEPTVAPTEEPTVAATEEPTVAPTEEPTVAPTEEPTVAATEEPTVAPTEEPTVVPTEEPASVRTEAPMVTGDVGIAADPSAAEYTNFQIQNLSSTTANVVVKVYNESGTLVASDTPPALSPGGYVAYTQNPLGSDPFNLGSGFKGSVVVESDQKVGAIANQFVGNLGTGQSSISAAYTGVDTPSTDLSFPLAYRSFNNWTTRIHLQNSTDTAANVQVTYTAYAGSANSKTATDSFSIPGNGSKTVSLYKDAVPTTLGTNWQGSVTIHSSKSLAGIADLYFDNPTDGSYYDFIMNYNGFTTSDTGTTLYAPTLFKRYLEPAFGWNTNIFVSNMGSASANICVTYSGNGASSTPHCINNVPINGAVRFQQFSEPDSTIPVNWTGSAKITGTQPVAAVVAMVTSTGANDRAAAFNALANSKLSTAYSAPFLMKWYAAPASWNTNFTAVIPDGSTRNVCVTYNTGARTCTSVAGTALIRQALDPNIPNGFRGSGTITSTVPFAIVVNMNGSPRDLSESYNAIPQ